MVEPLLKIDQLRKSFGGVLATDNLSLVIKIVTIESTIEVIKKNKLILLFIISKKNGYQIK